MKKNITIIVFFLILTLFCGCEAEQFYSQQTEESEVPENVISQKKNYTFENPEKSMEAFDIANNTYITIGDIEFQIPTNYICSEFKLLDNISANFYVENEDGCSLLFYEIKAEYTEEEWQNSKSIFIDSMKESHKDSSLLYSRNFSIGTYDGYKMCFINDSSCSIIAFVYSYEKQEIISANLIYDAGNEFDYRNDFEQILSNAKITTQQNETDKPSSKYDLAYIRKCSDYNLYYLFDTDENKVWYIVSNDLGIQEGTYSGEFNQGIDILWSGTGGWHEKVIYQKRNDPSIVLLFDADGFSYEFQKVNVSEAEKYMNRNGAHIITSY